MARNFTIHTDHNVGRILFEHLLPRVTARGVDRLADPALTAQAPPGTRFAIYTPACTLCPAPENSYGSNTSSWTSFILTGGTVKPFIQVSSRTLKEQIVPLKDKEGKDFLGNVSDNFGFRSVIQFPY